MSARTPNTVQALARGLALLELFTPERDSVTLAEASELLELPPATVHRLLATFEQARFVERDNLSGRYRLGVGLLGLLPALLHALRLPRAANARIARLAHETGETANLAVLDADEVLYVISHSGQRLMTIDTPPGLRLDTHCTALGKCLLGQLSDDDARAALGAEPYRRHTAATLTRWRDVRRHLVETRRAGYAVSRGELEDGLDSYAVPVGCAVGRPYAINVSAPSARLAAAAPDRIVGLLVAAADEIGGLLSTFDQLPTSRAFS